MIPTAPVAAMPAARRWLGVAGLLCGLGLTAAPASAQTPLADSPLFASNSVPGNLGLVLSVEFPTAISVAHTNRAYSNTTEYLGYFAPGKCYDYQYDTSVNLNNYFYPSAAAGADHTCSGKWSGNFLNWATMQTIDPFRWVLTGGYRVIDEPARTVIEKAWGTGQGGTSNFPDSSIDSSALAGATPFPASAVAMYMHVWNMGNRMRFTLPATTGLSFNAQFWNTSDRSGSVVLTRVDPAVDFNWGNGSPGAGVNADKFSARWTATVAAPSKGKYKFRIAGDDRVQLKINGNLLLDQTAYNNWAWIESGSQSFNKGETFTVEITMAEDFGGAGVKLQWLKPGDADYSTIGGGGAVSAYDSSVTATPFTTVAAMTAGGVYDVYVRAKVCDTNTAHGGVESNCTAYGSNWKPEGLLQRYANRIRYSAFSYLNDSNLLRDGGVLRARQKFVGPTQPVPGSAPVTNTAAEWDPNTGVFVRNPNATDASDTATLVGSTIADSGVINYLNKFGEITPGSYKTYDNVGELYYAAVRYFKNLGNVPEWTDMSGQSVATKTQYADGFPVITTWDDPILYYCQRNFLLGIGDVNTHADKDVPGNTLTGSEPGMPAKVKADTSVNAVTATNKLAVLEGLSPTLGTDRTYNAYTMAGLAYDSHTKDIRPDDPAQLAKTLGLQTLDTYWVDVQEYQQYVNNNQFYLATKYGGFKMPTGYDSYTNTTPLTESWWHTNTDTLGSNKRPDNYFSGGKPDLVKAGLETAFADIASKIKAYTTSFATSLPQVAVVGNKSYSSLYDASTWTGEITASELTFDVTSGDPSLVQKWTFTDKLAIQVGGTGWDTNRRIVTWNGSSGAQFCATGATTNCSSPITSTQLAALDPSYVTGDDRVSYLKYLRGDTTNEQGSTSSGSTKAYRTRTKLLGDIVGSKARPIGPPSYPLSEAANPGYTAFKTKWADRPTVIYVGANDGMMHAIHGDLTGTSAGLELFAYVPSALFQGPNGTPNVDGLASLGNPSFVHHYLVNATPDVHDVDFSRTVGGSGAPDWRSILIGGLGKGGKSYYAIDVTDPVGMAAGGEGTVASKVLWEFSNTDDADLGYTYGDPIVVKTAKYGWVVIIPSGYNNADGQGHLLILNPRTGKLLEKVSTGVGSTSNSAGLAFANAWLLDSSDGVADAVYAGDLLGNLWRWDITSPSSTYPAPLKMAALTDTSGNPQPVTSRPMIAVHPSLKKRMVMVGTGRLLDSSDIKDKQGQSFYAILDGTNAAFNSATDLPSPITFPITRSVLAGGIDVLKGTTLDLSTQMGWVEDFGTENNVGWRVTTDATTALGSVAWAATLPSIADPCSPSGKSRIYARDFATSLSTVKDSSGLVSYVPIGANVTDLRYMSVNGKLELISGTDTGGVGQVAITPPSTLSLRRLNWRELQTVD